MGENKKFLEIVDVKKSYGEGDTKQEVLRGMNFTVANGEFCVLLGPSGSGKSTLLRPLSEKRVSLQFQLIIPGCDSV